jgi:hypothetical protein
MVRAALALVLASSLAASSGRIFRWVDKTGDLHVTDRLADVPEPYYSMYAAEIARLEKNKGKQKSRDRSVAPAPRSTPPRSPGSSAAPAPPAGRRAGGPSIVDRELARQKQWQDLVARWRKELATATAEVEKIDQELAQARSNPILRTTPQARAQIEAIESRRVGALRKLERARKMLLETIPARARAEQVPPRWLM